MRHHFIFLSGWLQSASYFESFVKPELYFSDLAITWEFLDGGFLYNWNWRDYPRVAKLAAAAREKGRQVCICGFSDGASLTASIALYRPQAADRFVAYSCLPPRQPTRTEAKTIFTDSNHAIESLPPHPTDVQPAVWKRLLLASNKGDVKKCRQAVADLIVEHGCKHLEGNKTPLTNSLQTFHKGHFWDTRLTAEIMQWAMT